MDVDVVIPIAILALTAALAQQPASDPETAVINARLGPCSADFTVADAKGQPIYNATIHVRIRYGLLGVKRMDLEVGTNGDGKARFEGLPEKARPLVYDITKADRKRTVHQDLATECQATFAVALE